MDQLLSLRRVKWRTGMTERNWQGLATLLVLGLFVLICFTFLDYGATWDEEHSRANGELAIRWILSGLQDRAILTEGNYRLYGSFFNVLAHIASYFSPLGVVETTHFLTAMSGLVGIVAIYGCGKQIAGAAAGFFSALFLAVTPAYYGHSFNNPKDIPLASAFAVAFYFMLRTCTELPRPRWSLQAATGVSIGAALGIRVGALLLLGYLLLLWGGWLITESPRRNRRRMVGELARAFAPILGIAWVVMLAFWPYALVSPALNPFRTLHDLSNFPSSATTLFEGSQVPASRPPWDYLPTWFAVSLPEFLWLGTGFAVHRCLLDESRSSVLVKLGVAAVALTFPVAYAIAAHATLYDGLRHVLFVLPFLALLAGVGFAMLLEARMPASIQVALGVTITFSLCGAVRDMHALHPYESIYFNRTLGRGLKVAAASFETDYWGSSYKEGIDWLTINYYPRSPDKIRVANCSDPSLTRYLLQKTPEIRRRFVAVDTRDEADVFMATTRWNCDRTPGRVLHTVERMGTPLMRVIELKRRDPAR